MIWIVTDVTDGSSKRLRNCISLFIFSDRDCVTGPRPLAVGLTVCLNPVYRDNVAAHRVLASLQAGGEVSDSSSRDNAP